MEPKKGWDGIRIRTIGDIPRLHQMCDREKSAKHDTDATNNNVSDSHEGIPASHDSARRD